MSPDKRFNAQNHQEESLQQIAYDPSNILDDASQDENRNPQVRKMGAQIPGIHTVIPCPDILEAPASLCNITHCEPINCSPSHALELLLVEYNLDYLLKNSKAKARPRRCGLRDKRVLVCICYLHSQQCQTPALDSGNRDSSVPVVSLYRTSSSP